MPEMTGPRINRLLETAIYVDDLELAAQFYDRVFGLEPLLREQRVVAYDAGSSTVLLLFKRGVSMTGQSLPGGFIPAHDGWGPIHFCFAIDAEQVPLWEARLVQLGVPVESRMAWPSGGKSIYFRDPDQHLIELASPGVWRTY